MFIEYVLNTAFAGAFAFGKVFLGKEPLECMHLRRRQGGEQRRAAVSKRSVTGRREPARLSEI